MTAESETQSSTAQYQREAKLITRRQILTAWPFLFLFCISSVRFRVSASCSRINTASNRSKKNFVRSAQLSVVLSVLAIDLTFFFALPFSFVKGKE